VWEAVIGSTLAFGSTGRGFELQAEITGVVSTGYDSVRFLLLSTQTFLIRDRRIKLQRPCGNFAGLTQLSK